MIICSPEEMLNPSDSNSRANIAAFDLTFCMYVLNSAKGKLH